jgi:phage terminase large subunit
MELKIDTTISYKNQHNSPKRITQHVGGTRSGKTYAIIQWLIVQALQNKEIVTVVRKTIPSLKRTVIKDFKDILNGLGIWEEDSWNSTDRVYSLYNESEIQFISTDNPEKLRGLKSTILWLDEANEIDEESYFQLMIRTSGPIILSYNPTVSPFHWLRQMDDCHRYFTTFRDNPYLSKEIINSIKLLEKTNPKAWKIYGLGEFVANDKAIFNINTVDGMPADVEFIAYGIDFGYSADPTAIAAIWKRDNELWITEHCYERGMVTNEIGNLLIELTSGYRDEIWADSAEPRLIEELKRMGLNIKPVVKGKDSISFGISVLQNYKINIPKQCPNLLNEFYGYEWETDRFGRQLDRPNDFNNHLIDAARYVGMMRLSQKAASKGKYVISVR